VSRIARGVVVIGSAIISKDAGNDLFPWRRGARGQLSPSDDNQSRQGGKPVHEKRRPAGRARALLAMRRLPSLLSHLR
jgi:hypothetical protein